MWNGSIAFFGTTDLERTHQFYSELLGLSLYRDQGLCRIYAVPGGGLLGFCQHMAVTAQDKSPIITLLTEDVDGKYQKLARSGIEVVSKPQANTRFRIYHFFVKDPNGYTVEIQKFLDS